MWASVGQGRGKGAWGAGLEQWAKAREGLALNWDGAVPIGSGMGPGEVGEAVNSERQGRRATLVWHKGANVGFQPCLPCPEASYAPVGLEQGLRL